MPVKFVEISTDAIRILGDMVYLKIFLLEKFYRDSKLCTINRKEQAKFKLVIARSLNNDYA